MAADDEGAREQFRQLYAQLYPSVFSYAYQLLRDTESARDVTQDAFVALLFRWRRVHDPRSWLYGTVTHKVCDLWKGRSRNHSLLDRLVKRDKAVTAGPDLSVADAVNRLPSPYRETVLLYYYADLPLSDVARAVRRPEGTVKRWLSEARELLAKSLGDPHA